MTVRWPWADRVNELLGKFPSTNGKLVNALILVDCTATSYLILLLIGRDAGINSEVWIAWLGFLAALLGIETYRFVQKRKTYAAPSPDSERADVPAIPAPANAAQVDGIVVESPEPAGG